MRQRFFNKLLIINRRVVWIIYRYAFILFLFFDILLDLPGKFNISAMAGTIGDDPSFDRMAHERKITDDIKQFMTGRLIRKPELEVIQVTLTLDFDFVFTE